MKRCQGELQNIDVKKKKVKINLLNDSPLSPESPTELSKFEHTESEISKSNSHTSRGDIGEHVDDLNLATPTPSVSTSPSSRDISMEAEVSRNEEEQGEQQEQDCSLKVKENKNSKAQELADQFSSKLSPSEQIKNIIKSQFDLEILLKHRELRHIEDEMAKIQVMMIQLKQHSVDPKVPLKNEPAHFVETYAQYLKHPGDSSKYSSSDDTIAATPTSSSGRPQRLSALRSQTRSIRTCVTRRSDGALVKMVCSGCKRSNFGGVQGFINHCRISHSLEFSSHEQAANSCGVVIDEDEYNGITNGMSIGTSVYSNSTAGGTATTHIKNDSFLPIKSAKASKLVGGADVPNKSHIKSALSRSDSQIMSSQNHQVTSSSDILFKNTSNPENSKLQKFPSNFPPTAPPTAPSSRRVSESPAFSSNESINTSKSNNNDATPHLASLLKNKNINMDLNGMVVQAKEKFPKDYLIEGEEDFEPSGDELGDDATPFERVLAEAKRLRLNVDEIQKGSTGGNSDDFDMDKGVENGKKSANSRSTTTTTTTTNKKSSTVSGTNVGYGRSKNVTNETITSNSIQPPTRTSRRMPSDPSPLITRRRAAQLEMEKSKKENCGQEVIDVKKKENNVIGNISKYIQLSRFF